MIQKNKITIIILLLSGSLIINKANAQEIDNDFQSRTEFKLSFKPIKKVTISLAPEIRWDEYFAVSKYHLESQVSYKLLKGLTLSGSYRFIVNPRNTSSTEYLHRFALEADYGRKVFRFEPSARIKYTNYTEDASNGDFLRYRAKVGYDIKGVKLTPFISAEGFHDITENKLYKMRYSLGTSYKLNKHNSIKLGYSLDYYMLEYRNKHIINLGYKYKF